jgi:hypothetical protein
LNSQPIAKNSKQENAKKEEVFTTAQIIEALRTLRELVLYETGLPEERLRWSIESLEIDLVNILTRSPRITDSIRAMRVEKAWTLF